MPPFAHLSPARRWFLSSATGAIVAVGLVAAGWAVAERGSDAVAPVPSSALPTEDRPAAPGPVLLVHGYGGTSAGLVQLAAEIRAAGRTAIVVEPVGDNTGDLTEQVANLERAVRGAESAGATSVDVVGYSAGGVVALAWSKRHDGALRARRIVSLGSPFHGTTVASTALTFAPDQCLAACRQLAPGSDLLTSLDVDGAGAAHPGWVALWTRDDTVVTPPESGELKGAVALSVQSLCPGIAVSHTNLPADPVVRRVVLDALGDSALHAPSPELCA
ncbi:MAG: esterase/lipase family protein [Sporichthyaceae bacterium]